MAGPGEIVAKQVIKQIGKKGAKALIKKSGSRVAGQITRKSRSWTKAFAHIAEHFKPSPDKLRHAVFESRFRSQDAIEGLIKRTVSGPSRTPILTKLTVGGEPIGMPAVVIEREFPDVIGRIGDKECRILRIVVDITGRLQTAYPVERFFGAGVIAVGGASAGTASAADIPSPVQETYGDEAEYRESLMDRACEPKNWAEWAIELLLSPTCTALDPQEVISSQDLETRIAEAILRIERETGYTLDPQTRRNVSDDIKRIWMMGGLED